MYTISHTSLVLHDSPERIDFHVRNDDYLAFLATMMGQLEEALAKCADIPEAERKIARELRNDLRYVQANYTIVPRELGDIQEIRGKGNQLN